MDPNHIIEEDLQLIRRYFSKIKRPNHGDKVYKEECVLSFATPESKEGLFVSLSTFLAYGSDFVENDFKRTENGLYLHIKTTKTLKEKKEEDENKPKPTKLAIGVEGGFQLEKDMYDFSTVYSLYVLPEKKFFAFPNPNLPQLVIDSMNGVINFIDAEKQENIQQSWEEKRKVSKYAENLIQLDNNQKKISSNPKDWKCEDSGVTENLWLNLSTGYIGSGRRNPDGTGGSGAALRHFQETGSIYPLAVKLGTITPYGADVYSYAQDEDDMVEDPKLKEHLAHWGIDMEKMNKTEKTMDELNIEFNISFEYSKIVESGEDLKPISGAGYIGLKNLGNSCYCNSLYQVLLSLDHFSNRYLRPELLLNAPENPPNDLVTQFSKLAFGLLTEKYVEEGMISPMMIKHLLGRNHYEFGSNRQQDVLEYYQHVLTKIARSDMSDFNLEHYFSFGLENRLECLSSGQVRYTTSEENCISLPINIDDAINKEDVAKYEELSKSKADQEQQMNPVFPIVPFKTLLERFFSSEEIPDFYSPATQSKGIAIRRSRFSSMPKYLVLSLAKYVQNFDGSLKKLDVEIPVPESLDLENYRGNGLQDGEIELPNDDGDDKKEKQQPAIDDNIVATLKEFGFSENAAKRAAIAVNNASVEFATNWIMEHMGDDDLNDPLPSSSSASSSPSFEVNNEHLATIMSFGIDERHAKEGLKATGNDLERAVDWCFSHPPSVDVEMSDENNNADHHQANKSKSFNDGKGLYDLFAIISHIGKNTSSGHYVCHIKKNGKWIFFNDEKVFESKNPPLNFGYLYLYQRNDA